MLELFEKIASIPHCSGETRRLAQFIQDFAKKNGFSVESDEAGNTLCYKSKRHIALQSHYDMVCVGAAPKIEIVKENGYLEAKNSSLGADNGIGVAMMLALMEEGCEAEYLFTNDEEIGLVGAKRLSLRMQAGKMINLDSEEFGAIFVGCAGGVDLHAKVAFKKRKTAGKFYKIKTTAPGGHSGVDIHKEIPNAIKELAYFIKEQDLEVVSFKGGERINSIPAYAEAVVMGDLKAKAGVEVEYLGQDELEVFEKCFLDLLLAIPHGVRGWSEELGVPLHSQNLALVEADETVRVSLSVRSMQKVGLKCLEMENSALLEGFGCEVSIEDRYEPWEPRIDTFAKEMKRLYEKYAKNVEFKAIHAGLEAAVLAKKFPTMQILSVGPTIESPHSVHERVKIETIEPIYQMLKELLCAYSS